VYFKSGLFSRKDITNYKLITNIRIYELGIGTQKNNSPKYTTPK